MHPILKNIRSTVELSSPSTSTSHRQDYDTQDIGMVSCGIASKSEETDVLRTKQREERLPQAQIPVVDLFRDNSRPYMEDERDLRYNSAASLDIDSDKKLDVTDFRPDLMGSNKGQRHLEASELKRNGTHTRDLEQWAFDEFVSHAYQLILRPQTSLGLLYLADFVDTFVSQPPSHAMYSQMVLLLNHTQEHTLKRALGRITEKDEKGHLLYQWLIDLINVLDMIFRDEHTSRERLTALLTTTNHLALYFSKKASGGHYPSADKLAKTHTYFKRLVLSILALAESLGCYSRNTVPHRPLKQAHTFPETTDESYMFSLKGALEATHSDDEESDLGKLWTPDRQWAVSNKRLF